MSTKQIEKLLNDALLPKYIKVTDNTQAHAGHAGIQQNSAGHFHVVIVADIFAEKSLVQRHQLVYKVLADLMKQQIHALSIDALTPQEKSTKHI